MQHLVLSKHLVLVEIPVPKPTATKTKPASEGINHIWEIDRSGSMGGVLQSLVADLKTKARELPIGDTVSVGWFSGESQRSFVLKGFKLGGSEDFAVLDRVFDQMQYTVGMTCFSEILADTAQVIKDLSVFGNKFALCFFTDGYPTVGNYGREVERIYTAIDAIKGSLTSSLMVGYGDFYNKELMAQMSARLGASLIHSSDLPSFSVAFKTFTEDSREASGSNVYVSYEGCLGVQLLFSLNGKQINVLPTDKAPEVSVPLTNRAKDVLYVLATSAPMTSKEVKLTDKAFIGRTATQESLIKGAYAAACLLTQRVKTDQALEVLGTLGDKALVDAVTNAFTVAEYGDAEAKLVDAMAGPSKRMTGGRDTNYLPPENAFCLLDLLDMLKDAQFHPSHPDFDYKRTGVASLTAEGFGKFEAYEGGTTKLDQFTWNESRLNLSVLAHIKGTVDLQPRDGKVASDYGLLAKFPTSVYRNYTIVKDGALNITKLPVSGISQAIRSELAAKALIASVGGSISPDGKAIDTVYTLDLTKVPIVNRSIANGKTSAKTLCKLVAADLDYRGELKVYKFYRDSLEEKRTELAKGEVNGLDFLMKNGVNVAKGTYSPDKVAGEVTDYYDAKTFDINIKGASSLPKVTEVEAKLDDPKAKPLKVSEQGMAKAIRWYRSVQGEAPAVKLASVLDRITNISVIQRQNRRAIQETKFSVVLGKKWFDDLVSRDNPTMELDGRTFTFKLGTEKVKF